MGKPLRDNHGDWCYLELSTNSVREPIALVRFIELSRYVGIPLQKIEAGRRVRPKAYLVETQKWLQKAAEKLPKNSDYRNAIESDLDAVTMALMTTGFWTPEYKVALRREIT